MDKLILASRLSDLASEAEQFVNKIYLSEEDPAELIRHRAHRLRETLGTALLLSEQLAREAGNDSIVEVKERPDGTGEARFSVNL